MTLINKRSRKKYWNKQVIIKLIGNYIITNWNRKMHTLNLPQIPDQNLNK